MHGYPHIYDCPPPLVFDEAQGTCVREEQASSFARKCEASAVKANIEGFECPEGETIGPNGIPLAHPSFPHPTSCRKRLQSSGWNAIVIDGHDVEEICKAFHAAETTKGMPTVIIAKTFKGRDFPAIEDKMNWHGKPLGEKQRPSSPI